MKTSKDTNIKNKCGAEILSIGSELLLGNIVNTNSQWIAEQLAILGIPHFRQTVIGDNPARLKEAILEASNRSEILITTGGLGPTPDDITTKVIADTFNTNVQVSTIPKCMTCNNDVWDNRADKASGKVKPTYPDYKCKTKDCRIWYIDSYANDKKAPEEWYMPKVDVKPNDINDIDDDIPF